MSYRVALLARNVPPLYGGGGMLARTIALALIARGHTVDILTDTPSPEVIGGGRVLSPYRAKPSSHPLGRLRRRYSEYKWLKHTIGKGSYDLVYGVSAQHFTLSGVRAAQELGLPGAFETSLFGSDDYGTIAGKRWGFVLAKLFRSADRIVNISPPLEKACLEAKLPKEKLRMIPNPVDEGKFSPIQLEARADLRSRLGVDKSAELLLSAGAISHRKGYDRIVRMFVALAPQRPNLQLALAGPMDKQPESQAFVARLKQQLEAAKVGDRVRWLGRIDNVAEWMQAADLFVFGSRREGFGTVFTEAMATATPLVAFEIDGITDYILGECASICIVNNETAFLARVAKLLDQTGKKKDLSDQLLSRFKEKFTIERIMSEYENLFEELVKK